MPYNTTPTNDLIEETAELYALLMAELFIPVAVLLQSPEDGPRNVVVQFGPSHCQGVENAAMFWHEAITTPLIAAHVAAHELQEVTEDRCRRKVASNSPYAVEARKEVKRLRAIIGNSDMAIRRELRGLQVRLTRGI
ncbi:hypothetical protein B0I32_106271 [Nonomuraea fuscirosea]|uniref:Uncharacterized protein n=1 Tax=Nonomuraea fuscirosea TaxID=1291556 RepID=A0A2T0N2G2_9ACTN|nr:hypothetical protein [Nonomuraea fuscirosea]PRX66135.1 hypothetical protein B0I32_106271 [Nonomuraea fuscirosea]